MVTVSDILLRDLEEVLQRIPTGDLTRINAVTVCAGKLDRSRVTLYARSHWNSFRLGLEEGFIGEDSGEILRVDELDTRK